MKKLLAIINEEILSLEGVADKYAEKQFGIPDPNKDMERQANKDKTTPLDPNMGEYVGDIITENHYDNYYDDNNPIFEKKIYTKLFKNPKSLQKFDADVRAISDANGNIYVAQEDGDYYHEDIGKVIKLNAYAASEGIITWHRIDKSNNFGYSISYTTYANKYPEEALEQITIVDANQPFNFVNQYWEENLY